MEKLQFENEQFVLYSPDNLKYITDNMQAILVNSFEYYKILFDDIEKFINSINSF